MTRARPSTACGAAGAGSGPAPRWRAGPSAGTAGPAGSGGTARAAAGGRGAGPGLRPGWPGRGSGARSGGPAPAGAGPAPGPRRTGGPARAPAPARRRHRCRRPGAGRPPGRGGRGHAGAGRIRARTGADAATWAGRPARWDGGGSAVPTVANRGWVDRGAGPAAAGWGTRRDAGSDVPGTGRTGRRPGGDVRAGSSPRRRGVPFPRSAARTRTSWATGYRTSRQNAQGRRPTGSPLCRPGEQRARMGRVSRRALLLRRARRRRPGRARSSSRWPGGSYRLHGGGRGLLRRPAGPGHGGAAAQGGAAGAGATGALLDLGCGYGPIACVLATVAPQATVYAVDVNGRALDAGPGQRRGPRRWATGSCAADPDDVPADVRFDEIWSNPPIRVGKDGAARAARPLAAPAGPGRHRVAGRGQAPRRRLAAARGWPEQGWDGRAARQPEGLPGAPGQPSNNPGDERRPPDTGESLTRGVHRRRRVRHILADGRVLFADVSFRVGEGAKVALVGPNGAGKTTLLRMVAGDLPVHERRHRPLRRARRHAPVHRHDRATSRR